MPLKTYRKKGIAKISATELTWYHRRMRKYQGLKYEDVLAAKAIYEEDKAKFQELGLDLTIWFQLVEYECGLRQTHFNPIEFKQHFQIMAEMINLVANVEPKTLSELKPIMQENLKSLTEANAKLKFQESFADKSVGKGLLIAASMSAVPAILLMIPILGIITGPIGWLVCVGVAAVLFTTLAAGLVIYGRGASKRISQNLDNLTNRHTVKLMFSAMLQGANEAVKTFENHQTALNTSKIDRELRRSELEKIPTTDPDNQEREVYLQRFKKVCESNHLIRSAKEEHERLEALEKYKTVLGLNKSKDSKHLDASLDAVENNMNSLKTERSKISGEFQAHQRELTLKNPKFKPATFFAPTYALSRQKDSNEKNFFKPWKSRIARALV